MYGWYMQSELWDESCGLYYIADLVQWAEQIAQEEALVEEAKIVDPILVICKIFIQQMKIKIICYHLQLGK